MTKLYLIRHAQVTVDPAIASDRWLLTSGGLLAAARLRDLVAVDACAVYTSPEPKAVATAQALAPGRLLTVEPDLRELDRRAAGWVSTESEYFRLVREVLERPTESVRGCENAQFAQHRIVNAIARIVERESGRSVVAVSHGIVLTLYLAWLRGQAAPPLGAWRRVRMPDLAVVDPIRRVVWRDFGDDNPGGMAQLSKHRTQGEA